MHHLNMLLFVLLTLSITDVTLCQSWQFIGGPTGIPANDVIFTKDGRVLCSTAKGVFISDEYGDYWRISSSSQNFNGIYSLTERLNGEILAVARYGILKSIDRGENWFKVSDMSYLNDYGVKIIESPVDSSLYFAKDTSLYKSKDGGFNWKEIWMGDVIGGVMISESGWIYLIERYKNILISKDSGSTFSVMPIGYNLSNAEAYLMYSDKHGGFYFVLNNYTQWVTHFDNHSLNYISSGWDDIPLGVTSSGDLIYKSSNSIRLFEYSTKQDILISYPNFVKDQFARNVITKGNIWIANFSYAGIHRSNDGGKTWKSINNGLGFTQSTAMYITASGKFLVSAFSGGFWGNLYYSNDDGITWAQSYPMRDPVFYDIDSLSDGNLIATGSYGIFTASKDGTNWVQRKNADIASYVFVSKKGVAFTGTRPDGMMISSDNGISWNQPTGLNSKYFSSFGESSKGRIFASASDYTVGIYYSDDDGHNWEYINPFSYYGVYDFITKGDSIYAGTPGGCFKSDDNGLSWNRLNYTAIRKFEMAPNGDIVGIAAGNNGIVISNDNGTAWQNLGNELSNREIRDLCFDSDNQLYVLTDSGIFRNNKYIYPFIISPSYGVKKLLQPVKFEWSKISSANNYDLELYEDSLLNTVTLSMRINENSATINRLLTDKTYYWRVKANTNKFNYLYSNTGKFSTAPPFSLSQNFPNPFNASTLIEFYVPYSSTIKLIVYNVLGEVVTNLIDVEYPEGKFIYKWDASKLSSGIYFIKFEADEFKQIMKAMLIK